ncbi:MAG: FAD-dependent oxidoreductase [Sphingomonadales bacterium]|nr:FAD-dependent oxidoreductase [Sphingomonadales bacterium]
MKVVVIGGGIVGLSSAFYLHKAGHEVVVIDKEDLLQGCSYGNAGYICPSHFIPLATPGIVKQGLRWMWNSESPFYVQPRLDLSLLRWGWHFMRSATAKKAAAAAIPLRDISLLSQLEYARWATMPGMNFSYQHKGLLEIFKTEEKAAHCHHTLQQALSLGLSDTRLLNRQELQALEPTVQIDALGALYFGCDAHCYPNQLIPQLIEQLRSGGVEFITQAQVSGFDSDHRRIGKVMHSKGITTADQVVVATGSWGRQTAALLGIRIPLMPGRGYSVTLEPPGETRLNYPAILIEGRVAITPLSAGLVRFGGTMEITPHDTPPRYNRVRGILRSVADFYPDLAVPFPSTESIWYGYRPCSADGLPYIGKISTYSNVVVATGHAMLGLSLGAGTGKLVQEIIDEQTPSMDIRPFAVERF